jgi:hypothetical protein
MTTTETSITKDLTPLEAANLLTRLEEGQQAAWQSASEVPSSRQAEYRSRFRNALEVDGVFHDLMQETADNGMRRPNEPVEEFAERAGSDAWLAQAPDAGPLRAILDDPVTPEGRAFAKALSQTAAHYAREKQRSDPLPEPDRTPGAPHPDPFLASRGWHVNKHGVYVRRAEPEPEAPRDRELEAGS